MPPRSRRPAAPSRAAVPPPAAAPEPPEPERFVQGVLDLLCSKRLDQAQQDSLDRAEQRLAGNSERQDASAPAAAGPELDAAFTEQYGSSIASGQRTSLRQQERAQEADAKQQTAAAARAHMKAVAEIKQAQAAQKAANKAAKRTAREAEGAGPSKPSATRQPRRTAQDKLARDHALKDPVCAWFLDPRWPARFFDFRRWSYSAVIRRVRLDHLLPDLISDLSSYLPTAFGQPTTAVDDGHASLDNILGSTSTFESVLLGPDPFSWGPLLAVIRARLAQPPHPLASCSVAAPTAPITYTLAGERGVLIRTAKAPRERVFAHLSVSQCGLLGKDGAPAPQIIEKDKKGRWIGRGPTELVEHWKSDTVERLLPGWISLLDDVARWCSGPLKRIFYYLAQNPHKYRPSSLDVRTQDSLISYGAILLRVFYSAAKVDGIVVRLVEANGADAHRAFNVDNRGKLSMWMGRPTRSRYLYGRRVTVLVNNHSTKVLRTQSPWLRALSFLVYISTYLAEADKVMIGPRIDASRRASTLDAEYRIFLSSVGAEDDADKITFGDVLVRIGIDPDSSSSSYQQIASRAQAVLTSLTRTGRSWQFEVNPGDTLLKPDDPVDAEFGTVWQRLVRRMHEFGRAGVIARWASLDQVMKDTLISQGFITSEPSPMASINTTRALSHLCRSKWARIEAGYEEEARKLGLSPLTVKLVRGLTNAGPWASIKGRSVAELEEERFAAALYTPEVIWCEYVMTDKANFEAFFRLIQERLPLEYKLKATSFGPRARPGEPLQNFKKLSSTSSQLRPFDGSIQRLLTAAGFRIGFTDKIGERFNGSSLQEARARQAYNRIFGECEATEWDVDTLKAIFAIASSPARVAAGYLNLDETRDRRELLDGARTAMMLIKSRICDVHRISEMSDAGDDGENFDSDCSDDDDDPIDDSSDDSDADSDVDMYNFISRDEVMALLSAGEDSSSSWAPSDEDDDEDMLEVEA